MLGLFVFVFRSESRVISKILVSLAVSSLLSWKTSVPASRDTCPRCFGRELCESFENDEFDLHWLSRFSLLLSPEIASSAYVATLSGSEAVVLKSMSRRSRVSTETNESSLDAALSRLISENGYSSDEPLRNAVLCPNVKNLRLLFQNIDDNYENIVSERTLWLDIQISIEPLLLKVFAGDDNMPVPKLYGTCGDVIVKEFKGNPLSEYFAKDFMKKLYIAHQLLKMADAFTFSHPSFMFYFTDISPYNVVVDSSGKVSLIDLDHVILAERSSNRSGDYEDLRDVHVSPVFDPDDNLAISPADICAGSVSDHNYFVVCQHILMRSDDMNEGFLSNIPESVREQHHRLLDALNECAVPKKHSNRITSGRRLTEILEEIVTDFEWSQT